MKKYRTGMTRRVRNAVEKLDNTEGFSRSDLYHHIDHIKPLNLLEERSFYRTFRELYKRGELKRIGYAKYRFVKGLTPKAQVRQRIYRAMYVRRSFCAKDIRLLTDAESSYILAIIRKLKNDGQLEYTGISEKRKYFRVRQADEFYLNFVKDESNATD